MFGSEDALIKIDMSEFYWSATTSRAWSARLPDTSASTRVASSRKRSAARATAWCAVLDTYFTVNSVFFDPDIFGRFLALVMVLLAAVLLYNRNQRDQLATIGVLAVLWAGLVLTLSRSSLGALLVGMATLAAIRWRVSRAVVMAVVVVAIGAIAVAVSPKTFGLNQGLNGASSGRAGLVSGGIDMFKSRPLWGDPASGVFVTEYRKRHPQLDDAGRVTHDRDHDRRRAGPDRRARLHRTRPRLARRPAARHSG